MKEFFKKHTIFFCVILTFVALLTNFVIGYFQNNYTVKLSGYYLVEVVIKSITAALVFVLMLKWGYVRWGKERKIISGAAFGMPFILFIIENLVTLTLVEPMQIKPYWSVLIPILLAKTATGIMEEFGIRGVLLPLMVEKWSGTKHCYMRAAFASSLLFGCIHFSWTMREILITQSFSVENFLGNCHQVFYTFCVGMLFAGITLYAGSMIPAIIWHCLVSISAFLYTGLMQQTTYLYYYSNNLLNMQNVLNKYHILQGVTHGEMLIRLTVDIIILIVGIIVVRKAEKKAAI